MEKKSISTCNENGEKCLMLFGVNILAKNPMNKSFNMVNPSSCNEGNEDDNKENSEAGYLSDFHYQNKRQHAIRDKKNKGKQWTMEEHTKFLFGLKNLGKGNWKGISENFVQTKSSTQVASHAQKHFLRTGPYETRKRRPSLFDISLEEDEISEDFRVSPPMKTSKNSH